MRKNGNHKESSNAQTNGVDQKRTIHHRADLGCQNLQIRLRDGDQHTQDKAYRQQQPELTLFRQS